MKLHELSTEQLAIVMYAKDYECVRGKTRDFIRRLTKLNLTDADFDAVIKEGFIKQSKTGAITVRKFE